MRVSKRWQEFYFWVNYHFNIQDHFPRLHYAIHSLYSFFFVVFVLICIPTFVNFWLLVSALWSAEEVEIATEPSETTYKSKYHPIPLYNHSVSHVHHQIIFIFSHLSVLRQPTQTKPPLIFHSQASSRSNTNHWYLVFYSVFTCFRGCFHTWCDYLV